ncbi:hypothetical protein JCM1841_004920 [Sporobolomyces salmonicolor]
MSALLATAARLLGLLRCVQLPSHTAVDEANIGSQVAKLDSPSSTADAPVALDATTPSSSLSRTNGSLFALAHRCNASSVAQTLVDSAARAPSELNVADVDGASAAVLQGGSITAAVRQDVDLSKDSEEDLCLVDVFNQKRGCEEGGPEEEKCAQLPQFHLEPAATHPAEPFSFHDDMPEELVGYDTLPPVEPPPSSDGTMPKDLIIVMWWDSKRRKWITHIIDAFATLTPWIQDEVPYEYSFPHAMHDGLDRASAIFAIGTRGMGLHPHSLAFDLFPCFPRNIPVVMTCCGGRIPSLVVTSTMLEETMCRVLVADGIIATGTDVFLDRPPTEVRILLDKYSHIETKDLMTDRSDLPSSSAATRSAATSAGS